MSGYPTASPTIGAGAVSTQIFQAALGMAPPWYVADVVFDEAGKTVHINIDFQRDSRFRVADLDGDHPVHDMVTKRYRHLNFFQNECFLDVRVPRGKLPDGSVRQVMSRSRVHREQRPRKTTGMGFSRFPDGERRAFAVQRVAKKRTATE